jgi:hypothetical protein
MQTNDIALEPVESSQIHAVGFDPVTNRLAIQFKSKAGPGSIYHYRNFTADDFAAFRAAESLGAHFGKFIKPEAEKYPFEKVAASDLIPSPLPPKAEAVKTEDLGGMTGAELAGGDA